MTDTGNLLPSAICDRWDAEPDEICGALATFTYDRAGGPDPTRTGYRCDEHAAMLSEHTCPRRIDGRRAIPPLDVEQLVADAESQIDDVQRNPGAVLHDLLYRLRELAGLDVSGYSFSAGYVSPKAMIIGSPDRCLLTLPHSTELCGKPEGHRR